MLFFSLKQNEKLQDMSNGYMTSSYMLAGIHVLSMNLFICFIELLLPVDTGRKFNVRKTFRRGPGCLQNVLCKFNLRPEFKCMNHFAKFTWKRVQRIPLLVKSRPALNCTENGIPSQVYSCEIFENRFFQNASD